MDHHSVTYVILVPPDEHSPTHTVKKKTRISENPRDLSFSRARDLIGGKKREGIRTLSTALIRADQRARVHIYTYIQTCAPLTHFRTIGREKSGGRNTLLPRVWKETERGKMSGSNIAFVSAKLVRRRLFRGIRGAGSGDDVRAAIASSSFAVDLSCGLS